MTVDDLKNYKAVERPVLRGTLSRPADRVDAAAVVRRRRCCSRCSTCWRASISRPPTIRSRRICWSRPCATPMPTARICSAIRISSRRRSRACCRSATPRRLRAKIDRERATPSDKIKAANPAGFEGNNTTHFSIADRFGNAVANTYTLNLSYGVGMVAAGHRRAAQQRARRFRRRARRAERLRPGRLRGQRARPEQAAAVVDDADHRAAQRQAASSSPARRAAAASSPRCCRCCSTSSTTA